MKSKKLQLDSSILDDEPISYEQSNHQPNNHSNAQQVINTLDSDFKSYNKLTINPQRMEYNPEIDNRNNLPIKRTKPDEKADSVGSEYEFGNNSPKHNIITDKTKPVLDVINFLGESYLTIKTKKSSKISMHHQNTSEKIEHSDHNKYANHNDGSLKKSHFLKENNEGLFTIKKLNTPTAASQLKKNFKFDLSLLSKNEIKGGKVVHPHSCKNVNMGAILDFQDHKRKSGVNAIFINDDGSVDICNKINSGEKLFSRLNSDAKMSRASDNSEHNSVNMNGWAKKAQNYELKIDRLLLDQKFKLQNYKRMLEEKDGIISDLRSEVDRYRARCSELEEKLAMRFVDTKNKQVYGNHHNDISESDIFDSQDTTIVNNYNEYYSPSIDIQNKSPFLKLRKLDIDIDDVDDVPFRKNNHNNANRPFTAKNKYQTPHNKVRQSFKMSTNVNSNVKDGTKNSKHGTNYKIKEKPDAPNSKNQYNETGYYPTTNNLQMLSPKKLTAPSINFIPHNDKASIKMISHNDNRFTDSSKLKGKQLKVSETPKMSSSKTNTGFGPAKNFFAQYKKETTNKNVKTNPDMKKLQSSINSRIIGSDSQKCLLEISQDIKGTSIQSENNRTGFIKSKVIRLP